MSVVVVTVFVRMERRWGGGGGEGDGGGHATETGRQVLALAIAFGLVGQINEGEGEMVVMVVGFNRERWLWGGDVTDDMSRICHGILTIVTHQDFHYLGSSKPKVKPVQESWVL
jgi:hypothetical protein